MNKFEIDEKNMSFVHCLKPEPVIFIPEKVKTMNTTSFDGCKDKLHRIYDMPGSAIEQFNLTVCKDCYNLQLVNLSNSTNLTHLGLEAFKNCVKLDTILFPDTLNSEVFVLGYGCFENTGLTEIKLPDNCNGLNGRVFADCKKLDKIYLGDKINFINKTAFEGCDNLRFIGFKDEESMHLLDDNECMETLLKCKNLHYIKFGHIQFTKIYNKDEWIKEEHPVIY